MKNSYYYSIILFTYSIIYGNGLAGILLHIFSDFLVHFWSSKSKVGDHRLLLWKKFHNGLSFSLKGCIIVLDFVYFGGLLRFSRKEKKNRLWVQHFCWDYEVFGGLGFVLDYWNSSFHVSWFSQPRRERLIKSWYFFLFSFFYSASLSKKDLFI